MTSLPGPWLVREPARRRCQHCELDIFPVAMGLWQDRDGFTVCMKYTGPLAGAQAGYIFHTPLPEVT